MELLGNKERFHTFNIINMLWHEVDIKRRKTVPDTSIQHLFKNCQCFLFPPGLSISIDEKSIAHNIRFKSSSLHLEWEFISKLKQEIEYLNIKKSDNPFSITAVTTRRYSIQSFHNTQLSAKNVVANFFSPTKNWVASTYIRACICFKIFVAGLMPLSSIICCETLDIPHLVTCMLE